MMVEGRVIVSYPTRLLKIEAYDAIYEDIQQEEEDDKPTAHGDALRLEEGREDER